MTRLELAKEFAANAGLSVTAADALIVELINTIKSTTERGETVSINGFGSFSVKTRAARTGRNPKTGEAVACPASARLAFKMSPNWRKELKGDKALELAAA